METIKWPVCLFYYDMIHGEGHFADCKINRLVTVIDYCMDIGARA